MYYIQNEEWEKEREIRDFFLLKTMDVCVCVSNFITESVLYGFCPHVYRFIWNGRRMDFSCPLGSVSIGKHRTVCQVGKYVCIYAFHKHIALLSFNLTAVFAILNFKRRIQVFFFSQSLV